MPIQRKGSGAGGGGGGGGSGPLTTTKKTYKTVQFGVEAEIAAADFDHGVRVNVEHGLGKTPDGIISYLEAITVDLGYAVGTKIPIQVPWSIVSSHDATHTYITCRSGDARFDIVNRNTSVKAKFTFSRWKFVAASYIFVDTEVVTEVVGSSAISGNDLFLGPDEEPTEEDWEAHKGKWTGRVIAPIDRDLIGGHASVARFATINNDSATTGFGFEQLSRTTVYATMTAAIDFDTHEYWLWASGQAVEAGDFAYQSIGGTEVYSICLRAHTTATGNVADGSPSSSAQTGWVTHTPAEVVNRATFAGIVGHLSDVDTTSLSHGDWVASIVDDFMSLWAWTTTHNDWLSYFPSSIGSLHESGYANNAQAAAEVRAFDSSSPDYYLINGKLKILLSYIAPTAGAAVYYANPQFSGNPREYWYGVGQTVRRPTTWPNTDDGGVASGTPTLLDIRRLRFAADGPHEEYHGGGSLIEFIPSADVSSDIDAGTNLNDLTVFKVTSPGRYKVTIYSGNDDSAEGDIACILRQVTSGIDDYEVIAAPGYRLSSAGTPTLLVEAKAVEDDLLFDGTEQLYLGWTHLQSDSVNTRHWLRIERVG